MTRNIFVTGGVVSSLGKGLTSASIGLLLERMGYRVAMQKFDPYINVDPGTMNPYQHGEVYVTADGVETDLDLGHYERYTNALVHAHSNYTTGKIYSAVIARERRGEYLGQTVQVIPHITNEIQEAIRLNEGPEIDVAITEVGGTVGDIESLPFLEAVRQYRLAKGPGATAAVHLTLVPFLRASQEMKTKPTQQSVERLRQIGIQPDLLICRTEQPLTDEMRAKISLFCNVPSSHVIEERDVSFSVYEIPLMLAQQGVHRLLARTLGLPEREPRLDDWQAMLEQMRHPEATVEIAVVGKYLELHDAYKSIFEGLSHGAIANRAALRIRKVPAESLTPATAHEQLAPAHGILVPGGFGYRGVEGKIEAARYARERKIPYYGICLGMQVAAIEFARNVLGLAGAHSTEFEPETPHPVIDLMQSQRAVRQMGGTMRLGSYRCRIAPGTRARAAYTTDEVFERHRHRYEFHNAYRARFEEQGVRFSGIWPDGDLVEIMEYVDHPWFVAVQFHPEFQSKPNRPHPLFRAFIAAARTRAEEPP